MTGKTQGLDGWQWVRLGDVAEVSFSGVDKKSVEGEVPVELCNYTDVFYNRRIQNGMEFMAATATPVECSKWALMAGDVLFTKDSETPEEIGIPSYVADDLPNVLCGYHLGLARPSPATVSGAFLARTLASPSSGREFGRMANGVTRFGLTLDATRTLPILLPPLPEQRAIVTVLDSIDDAIDHTDAVIVSTEQLRDSLLHQLLTRGVPGWHTAWNNVPGLGMMPADWEVVSLGDVVEVLDSKRIPLNADDRANMSRVYPYYGANGIVDYVDHWIFDEKQDLILLAEDGGHFDEFATRPIAYRVRGKCWVNNHAHVLKSKDVGMSSFIFHSIVNKDIRPFINGTTRSKLTQADLREVPIGVPPVTEQLVVSGVLDEVDMTLEQVRRERERLQVLKESTADTLLTGRTRTVH